jgi:hypothetical protein
MLILSVANADKIKNKTLACPTVEQLHKAPAYKDDDNLALDMYIVANDCVIVTPQDKIEAVGYDPRNSQEIYQKVINKENGSAYYILRAQIFVEQGGKKASMRF